MQRLSIEKSGDALFPEVPAPGYSSFTGLGGMLSNKMMHKYHGGVWIDGTLSSDGDWFNFDPGLFSSFYYDNTRQLKFHISEVRGIRRESGIIKDTIVFELTRGEFKFCCFGAEELAATLQSYLQYVQSFNNR